MRVLKIESENYQTQIEFGIEYWCLHLELIILWFQAGKLVQWIIQKWTESSTAFDG